MNVQVDASLTPALRRWLQQHVLVQDGHPMEVLDQVVRVLVELAAGGDEEAIVRLSYLRRAAHDLADMEANLAFLPRMLRNTAENLTR